MLYYLGNYIQQFWGPARLLTSNAVLIAFVVYLGFFASRFLIPAFYKFMPHDRGREFTVNAEQAKGKPTGTGSIFITFFVIICFLFIPMNIYQMIIVGITWITMLTGFFDDRSTKSWGEYRKALLDLIIAVGTSFVLYYCSKSSSDDGIVYFWLPFFANPVKINMAVYIVTCTILIWASINTTNCTDGVDGLSATLVLLALFTLGAMLYFVLGHTDISKYLLVPHLEDGAKWGAMTFAMAGVVMGYLWHNAFPSKCLMGDAGSRALGYFIGVGVIVTGNPFLILATSSIIFINGGMGLIKVFLLRFFKIRIFEKITFPLHDHMRNKKGWSPTQVLLKFVIIQALITTGLIGIFFKIR